jgi:hypothetical protein
MNAILRDGPAGGEAVTVPEPLPRTLSIEVRPQIPDGPVQPGDEFPTVSGPVYGYKLAPVPMAGAYAVNSPAPTIMWTAFYVYDAGANPELADHQVCVKEEHLDVDRTWDIIDGPEEVGPEGRDSRAFRYRYRQRDTEKSAVVYLSGTAVCSPQGLEPHIGEIVLSYGAAALVKSLRLGRAPNAITVYSNGGIIEDPAV